MLDYTRTEGVLALCLAVLLPCLAIITPSLGFTSISARDYPLSLIFLAISIRPDGLLLEFHRLVLAISTIGL